MERRNVLFLMTDQHRIDTLGSYGNVHAHTPNIDALTGRGARFSNAFTPTAICTPARASLLTGQAPFRHGLLANAEWNIGYRTDLPLDIPTYSGELRRAGYNVGHVGKWHVGETQGPNSFGFDGLHIPGAINPVLHPVYQEYLRRHDLPPVRITDRIHGTLPGGRRGHLIAARLQQPVQATFEHFLADEAITMLRQYADSDHPFSINLHFFGPHLPYLIPDEYFDLIDPADVQIPNNFQETFAGKPKIQQNYSTYWGSDSFTRDEWRKLIAVYWGYVSLIDYEIGRVLAALDELRLTDSTAVFFTADHGEFTGSHRLNDKGPAMYDDIYRIPCIVALPGQEACIRNEFVTLLDMPATILDWAGADTEIAVDGRSVLPLVRGETVRDWRTDVVAEFHGHHFHYQQRMLRTRTHKLVVSPESVNELYDLKADPDELVNIYAVPLVDAIRRRMCRRLYAELTERGDVVFARWMAATIDMDVAVVGGSRSDYDQINAEADSEQARHAGLCLDGE